MYEDTTHKWNPLIQRFSRPTGNDRVGPTSFRTCLPYPFGQTEDKRQWAPALPEQVRLIDLKWVCPAGRKPSRLSACPLLTRNSLERIRDQILSSHAPGCMC